MTSECIYCEMENAYHNGVCYECPDCGKEWDDGMNFDKEEEYDDEE